MYTRTVAPAARAAAAAFGRQPVGPARGDRRLAGRRTRIPARDARGDGGRRGRRTRASRGGSKPAGVTADHELIVVHVSAGNPFRRWPEPAFTALVAGACRRARRIGGSCSARGRPIAQAAARIAAAAPGSRWRRRADRVVDFGEFDLAELRALVERSRLFVGGDTGPLHIAATTATPIVGIYGPTLPHDRRRGGTRGSRPNPSTSRGCRAGRAISVSARLAIFDV